MRNGSVFDWVGLCTDRQCLNDYRKMIAYAKLQHINAMRSKKPQRYNELTRRALAQIGNQMKFATIWSVPSQLNNDKGKNSCVQLLRRSRVDKIWELTTRTKCHHRSPCYFIIKESLLFYPIPWLTNSRLLQEICHVISTTLYVTLWFQSAHRKSHEQVGKRTGDTRGLCGQKQTQLHVLSSF